MTEPRIAVRGAVVRFDDEPALDGMDLDVVPGEVVAVLGPSGSGKSTLLRAIAGLQPLDAGRVSVDGRDQVDVPPHRRGIGLMFQDNALFPHRDVHGNIAFGLRMQHLPASAIDARVRQLLELVDLRDYAARRVDTLSGGEQQRVALARALAPSPRALLLDEPLGSLDRSLRDRLVMELRAIFVEVGLTVVSVTHDHSEAFAMADRVAVVDRGRVIQVDRPSALWARPATRRVAEVLGFANLVDAVRRDGRVATPWAEIPVAGADGPASIHIRPSGVRLEREPDAPGVVRACRFRGDHVSVVVDVDGAPSLEAEVAAPGPAVGDRVAVRIDPAAVVPLQA